MFLILLHNLISTIVTHRQEALLAAISEKDANIALLELSSSKKKKTQEEVAQLRREKDRLVQQLKQQVRTASQGSDWAYLSVLKVKLFVCFKFRVTVEHKRPRHNTSLFWLVDFWMQECNWCAFNWSLLKHPPPNLLFSSVSTHPKSFLTSVPPLFS